MSRMLLAASVLLLTASCDQTLPPLEHASLDFTTTVEGQEVALTYEGTHDVIRDEDPDIRLLVLVHHDGRVNPVSSFNYVMSALDSAAAERPELRLPETTMVLSPGMISDWHMIDNPGRYADGHYAWWAGGWWRGGADSPVLPTVSNFELIDALILHVADRFPNLRAVVQVGHSAGGQLVSRYAVGTTVHDQLRQRGIYMRSIIANPSSFLYLDRQRPDLAAESGFIDHTDADPLVAEEPCATFNGYLYGMEHLVPYMGRRPIDVTLAMFQTRDIWILSGMEDNEVRPDMDTSCPATLQGRHRLERARRYYEYLGHFFGPEVYQSKFIELVPDVGHDGERLYASDQGKAIIFIDADSAAAAMGGDRVSGSE